MKTILYLILLFVLSSCDLGMRVAELDPKYGNKQDHELLGKKYMIASQGPLTTKAAQTVLNKGGNIVDAAIAASFAISVERPHSTGLGGGGFLIYYNAKTFKTYVYDFRETAPDSFHKKMYVNDKGEQIKDKSSTGPFAVGVPGLVKGLDTIHREHGKIDWSETVAPAIAIAESMPVYPTLEEVIKIEEKRLKQFDAAKDIFFKEGRAYKVGENIEQKDLAQTLRKISQDRGRDFYTGAIAKKIVDTVNKYGGKMTLADMKNYRVQKREPVRGKYKDYEIVSMPPPSSGGTHILQILNILEGYDLNDYGVQSPLAIHLTSAAMQIAFFDRTQYMGDADFVKVPVKQLISKRYAQDLRKKINLTKAFKFEDFKGQVDILKESNDTTHFTLMDIDGNVVVSTQTINGLFGSAMVAEGTGIVLNNEMDDFAASVKGKNIYGILGGENNLPEPKKRPLSSMSPTIVFKSGKPVLALGTPNGPRILTCVMHTILNYVEFKMPLWESVAATRFHHQWYPDKLRVDAPYFKDKTIKALENMGYKIDKNPYNCRIQAVAHEGALLHGVSDMRAEGQVLGE
jgi:gamma-glutamyltranspeptidase/glutathione hydrolase